MTENVHRLVQNVMRTQKYMNTKYMKWKVTIVLMRPNNQNKLLQITTRINIYMKFLIYVAQPEKKEQFYLPLSQTHAQPHTHITYTFYWAIAWSVSTVSLLA